MKQNKKILIVGAGFAGSTMARELAEAGFEVTIIDKRHHIGGNAYDDFDSHGVMVHRYGPHIFHTNSTRIYDYLSRFTQWRSYEHHVRVSTGGELYSFPVNRITLQQVFGVVLKDDEVQAYLDTIRTQVHPVFTSEDVLLNKVGKKLTDFFFRGYTRKQWGRDLKDLSPSVVERIPVRMNADERYFSDRIQVMPKHGYHVLFSNLLDHPKIVFEPGVRYEELDDSDKFSHTVYTGPIDQYFGFSLGRLPYRSLTFEYEYLPHTDKYQDVGTINFPNEYEYTRITEFKHLTGQKCIGTSIVKEYPCDDGEPYYPVPSKESLELGRKYYKLAERSEDVTFVGRLAQYRYYNMDQVVASSLKKSKQLIQYLNS